MTRAGNGRARENADPAPDVDAIIDYERAIAGGVVRGAQLSELRQILSPDLFRDVAMGQVYRVGLRLEAEGVPRDFTTIAAALEQESFTPTGGTWLERVGGRATVGQLESWCPSELSLPHYAAELVRIAARRNGDVIPRRTERLELKRSGPGYEAIAVGGAIKLSVEQLAVEHHELYGWLRVAWTRSGASPLYTGRFNFTGITSRSTFAKHMQAHTPGAEIPWLDVIEEFAPAVVEAFRTGPAPILLKDVVEPPAVGWALKPILIAADPVIMFGDGGALKSYLALASAVAMQAGIALVDGLEPARAFNVAYLDFEWNPWPHHRRLRAICGAGQLPEILYIDCKTSGPLTHQVERLQRIFAEHSIDYAIVDSVALACDGPPEEAQSAIGFFQALARLEVGSLLIAHINKDSDVQKPFGSAYWHNSARATWYVKRLRASEQLGVDVALYNRKQNDGPLHEPIGLHVDFADGSTNVARVKVDEAPAPESGSSVARMAQLLRQGALLDDEIAEKLGISASTVRSNVKRHPERFTRIPDGSIGLVLQ